ncbi:hypothetical protein [Paenibacillus sp. CMAA1364]
MTDEHDDTSDYVKLFNVFFKSCSKMVKYMFLLLVSFMIGYQIVVHIPSLRTHVSSVYRLDGLPLSEINVKKWYND